MTTPNNSRTSGRALGAPRIAIGTARRAATASRVRLGDPMKLQTIANTAAATRATSTLRPRGVFATRKNRTELHDRAEREQQVQLEKVPRRLTIE
jgi:hypothetical protein